MNINTTEAGIYDFSGNTITHLFMNNTEESAGRLSPEKRKEAVKTISIIVTLRDGLSQPRQYDSNNIVQSIEHRLNMITDNKYERYSCYPYSKYRYFKEFNRISRYLKKFKYLRWEDAKAKSQRLLDMVVDLIWKLDNPPVKKNIPKYEQKLCNIKSIKGYYFRINSSNVLIDYNIQKDTKWTAFYEPKVNPAFPWRMNRKGFNIRITEDVFNKIFREQVI